MSRLAGQYSQETEALREWCDKHSCVMKVFKNFHNQEEYRILMGGTAYNNNIRNLVIPDGFHEIIEYAFKGNQWMNLKSIKLPSTLIEIERGAIYNSTKIIVPYNISSKTIEKLVHNGYRFSYEERKLQFIENIMLLKNMQKAFCIIGNDTFDTNIKKYSKTIIKYIDYLTESKEIRSESNKEIEDDLHSLSKAYGLISIMEKHYPNKDNKKYDNVNYKEARSRLGRLVDNLNIKKKGCVNKCINMYI